MQYRTDANLAARQSIYAYQHPRIDLQARVIDLAAPAPGATVADVGCGNGAYLAELARRGFAGPGARPGHVTRHAGGRPRAAGLGRRAVRSGVGSGRRGGVVGDRGVSPETVGSPATGFAGDVALLAADATALPLPDGAADLTLAMHMLYHVPDPSQALRELRRVTRPGGRVVIGLNGLDHLRELREIVAAVRGDGRWGRRERLTLDDGEALARSCFSTVARHDFAAELRLAGPRADRGLRALHVRHPARRRPRASRRRGRRPIPGRPRRRPHRHHPHRLPHLRGLA